MMAATLSAEAGLSLLRLAPALQNVGAPTFKVLLEVQECLTKRRGTAVSGNSQNGTRSEVIA
jgi:DNA-binding phage protein